MPWRRFGAGVPLVKIGVERQDGDRHGAGLLTLVSCRGRGVSYMDMLIPDSGQLAMVIRRNALQVLDKFPKALIYCVVETTKGSKISKSW